VLILDEPTNHLDLESREALEDALLAFPGALLLVSHDRALVEAVGTRTIAVEDYGLRSYVGGWQEYGPPARPPSSPGARRSHRPRRRGWPDGMALKRSEDLIGESEAPPRGAARAAAATGRNGAGKNGGGAARPAAAEKPAAAPGTVSKNRARQLAKLESAVDQAELDLAATEEALADPAAWATPYETAKSTARHTKAKRAVELAYAELEAFEAAAPA
jgi:ATP-binding cassette subfamily F protein 3